MTRNSVLGALLFLGVFVVFAAVAGHEFVRYDDPVYVLENEVVRQGLSGRGFSWAFGLHGYAANWHPLTWLSHMLDVELFGPDNAGPHHLVNVFWHASSAVVLFWALLLATRSLTPSFIVAALFAFHPLRVESVAWIAERKDVLSGFFFMATLWAYVRHAQAPGKLRYALVLGALALGLLAKPVLVTVPCVLLLFDLWPLGRVAPGAPAAGIVPKGWRFCLLEKVPLVLLVGLSSWLTLTAQRSGGAVHPFWSLSMTERVQNAVLSYGAYLHKTLWPAKLGVFYPHPAIIDSEAFRASWPAAVGVGLLLLAVTALAVARLRRWPFLFVGWSWFLGMLVPMIGILQVGNQAMADRYAYLPLIGIYLAVVWGVAGWCEGQPGRSRLALAVAAVALLGYAGATRRLVGTWKNTETLFEHALAASEDNYVAHLNLGQVYRDRGDLEAAEDSFRAALAINRNISEAQNNLGVVLLLQRRAGEARRHLAEALRIKPSYAEAHYNMALALHQLGDTTGTARHYRQALVHDPNLAEAHNNLGVLLRDMGQRKEARQHFEQALRIRPNYEDPRRNLMELGR